MHRRFDSFFLKKNNSFFLSSRASKRLCVRQMQSLFPLAAALVLGGFVERTTAALTCSGDHVLLDTERCRVDDINRVFTNGKPGLDHGLDVCKDGKPSGYKGLETPGPSKAACVETAAAIMAEGSGYDGPPVACQEIVEVRSSLFVSQFVQLLLR